MPKFYDEQGKPVVLPDGAAAQQLYQAGKALPVKGQKVPMVVPGGEVREFDAEALDGAIAAGARIANDDEYHKAQLKAKYGKTGEAVAFAAGAARGLTAGLSDAAIIEGTRIFGGEKAGEDRRKTLRDMKDLHPVISGVGEAAGTLGGMFIGTGEEAAAVKAAELANEAREGVTAAEAAKALAGAGEVAGDAAKAGKAIDLVAPRLARAEESTAAREIPMPMRRMREYPANDNLVANDNAIGLPALPAGEAPAARALPVAAGEPAAASAAERVVIPPGGPDTAAPAMLSQAVASSPKIPLSPVRAIDMFGGAIERAATDVLGNGLAGKVVARAARGAGEMGAFEIGNEISESELNDTPLVGEQTLAHLGHAAVLGGLLGAGSGVLGHALESLSPSLRKAAAEQRFKSLSPKQKYMKQADQFVKGEGANGLTGWRYVGDVLNRKNIGGSVEEMRVQLAKEVPIAGEKVSRLYDAVDAKVRPLDLYNKLTTMADEQAKTWGNEAAVGTLLAYRDSLAKAAGLVDEEGMLLPTAGAKEMRFADAVQQRMGLDDLIYSETNPLAPSAKAKVLREFRHAFDDHLMAVAEQAEKKAENSVTRKMMEEAKKDYQALRLAKKAVDDSAAAINSGRTLHLSDNIWGASAAGGITGMLHNPVGIPMGLAVATGHKYLRENGSDLAAKTFYRLADIGSLKEASNIAAADAKKAVGNAFGEYRSRPKFKTYKSREERDARFETTVMAVTSAAARRNDLVDALGNVQGPTLSAPQVHASMSSATLRGLDYLAQRIPDGHNGTNTLQPGLDQRAVSDADKARWLRVYDAVDKPLDTLAEGLKHGTITKDQIEAIKNVYPTVYDNFAQQTMDKVAEKTLKGKKVTYQQKIHLNTVLGIEPDRSFNAAFISDMQKVYVANADRHGKAGRPPTPGVNAKPLQGFSLELATDFDKLEMGGKNHR